MARSTSTSVLLLLLPVPAAVIQKLLSDSGNQTIFTPIVMSASGAMGPSMIAFLQGVYERTKAAGKFEMR